MGAPRVSIIIPTWNRCDLVSACLDSLAAQTFRDFETVVVDDASSDGTAEAVARMFPAARVLRLDHNRGFARAVNHGIAAASGDFLFLLNNDMTLDPNCVEQLVTCADRTGAEMVAPLVLWRDQPDTIYSAGDCIRANGRPESIGFRAPRAEFPPPAHVFGVSAGAGLFHRRVLERAGPLDERFLAYYEDADLCFRARLAGFRAAFCPGAVAFHIGSASIAGRTWWRSRQCFRNHALLVIKDVPGMLLLRHGPGFLREHLHQARMCFSACRTARGAVWAAWMTGTAWLSLLAATPHALRLRRNIQRGRVLTVRDVSALMRG